jgi:hypothetical protein
MAGKHSDLFAKLKTAVKSRLLLILKDINNLAGTIVSVESSTAAMGEKPFQTFRIRRGSARWQSA